MPKYPWPEIQEKWETGQYTMADLAEEYGFNQNYGHQKASKEGWEKGRTKKAIRKKAGKKVREEEAEKEAKLRKEYEMIINNIRRATSNELFAENEAGENHTDFDRLKQLKIGSQIIHNCRREQWEVNEILETADQAEIKQQTDKLEALIGGIEDAPVEE